MIKQKLFPDACANGNLTVRAALANNAPEIPSWFKIEFRNQPAHPGNLTVFFSSHKLVGLIKKYWDDENDDWAFPVEMIEVEGATADEVIAFQKEVTEHFKKIQKYFEDQRIWGYEYAMAIFFQWRTFYADQLIAELNKD